MLTPSLPVILDQNASIANNSGLISTVGGGLEHDIASWNTSSGITDLIMATKLSEEGAARRNKILSETI